jgi:DNA-directed RNA polymerase subunit RPC12/RpoP
MSESASSGETTPIQQGTVVFDHEDYVLGVVTEMTAEGFEVTIGVDVEEADVDDEGRVDLDSLETESGPTASGDDLDASVQEHDPGHEFGEGYLVWRCDACGAMGELEDGLPAECPDCGSEDVYKRRED